MPEFCLIRYGLIPEVARFAVLPGRALTRGERVVIQTPRGLEMGMALEQVRAPQGAEASDSGFTIDRVATAADEETASQLRADAQVAFDEWLTRIAEWQLDLELIDLEWTLDRQKLILYVLTGRGPDSTKLALFAATMGVAVEVLPVTAEGLMVPPASSGGGCGSGGCGCHDE